MGNISIPFLPEETVGDGVAYLGVDPGAEGGLAVVRRSALHSAYRGVIGLDPVSDVDICRRPETDTDLLELLQGYADRGVWHAALEQQIPRPTRWFDRVRGTWTSSILKSTCLLYGDYLRLRMALAAAGISIEIVTPQVWQKALSIPPRKKEEGRTSWKNRLKAKAQQLFPGVRVTLATADALLLAVYCQRKREGRL